MDKLFVDVEANMQYLLQHLKCANKGIDVWQSSRAYVLGFREQQLAYFYSQRDRLLAKLKAYRR